MDQSSGLDHSIVSLAKSVSTQYLSLGVSMHRCVLANPILVVILRWISFKFKGGGGKKWYYTLCCLMVKELRHGVRILKS